ncbi:DUF1295 domain-containing protein [Robiginitomaculum antarcticum]|uniref:DUF1295 domain-containing protein n=1 Tax=Robiginitomaculum antarcticum TaxID=437507 RepID=UPI0003705475|nr:DUF1295 domain-containing protein [Robiginitomaculum antarcticum]
MPKHTRRAVIAIIFGTLIGLGMGWAGSQGGLQLGGIGIFMLCTLLAYLINWIIYVPSALAQTEHYFDLTGALTYLSMIAAALFMSGNFSARGVIASTMVAIWAIRLGAFLFRRVKKAGKDGRFDDLKTHPVIFFQVWTLQGLWCVLTVACALAIITSGIDKPIGLVGYIGIAVWIIGCAIEAIADHQKTRFKNDLKNEGDFINEGLWAWSRHPNYFGEITLWTGMAILAFPILSGWQYAVLISPVFIYLLLTRVSGIPMLERRGKQKWGDDAEYQAYLANTNRLLPWPPAAD